MSLWLEGRKWQETVVLNNPNKMYKPQSHRLSKPVRELRMQLQKERRTEISQPKASWIFSCQGRGISKRPERILHSPKHFRFSTDNSYRWDRKAESNPSKAFQAEQSLHKFQKPVAGPESKGNSPTMYKAVSRVVNQREIHHGVESWWKTWINLGSLGSIHT